MVAWFIVCMCAILFFLLQRKVSVRKNGHMCHVPFRNKTLQVYTEKDSWVLHVLNVWLDMHFFVYGLSDIHQMY